MLDAFQPTLPQDTDDLPAELTKAIDKFNKRQAYVEKSQGGGDTEAGLAIAEACLPKLAQVYRSELEAPQPSNINRRKLSLLLGKLDPEVLAACVLQTALHCVATTHHKDAKPRGWMRTCVYVGKAVAGELWAAGLTQDNPKTAKRVRTEVAKLAVQAKRRTGSVKRRQQAVRVGVATALGRVRDYQNKRWSEIEYVTAGAWCLNLLLSTLPEMFTTERMEDDELALTITDGAYAVADAAVGLAVLRNPVWLPTTQPPMPWTGLHTGGTWDKRLQPSLALVRTRHKEAQAAIGKAIHTGQMQETLAAVNRLQAVPWRINKRILGVIETVMAKGIEVKGLPRTQPILPPEISDEEFEQLPEKQQRGWRARIAKILTANHAMKSDRALYAEDMAVANAMAEHDRFWTPMNLDWRGRVYSVPSFAFPREDRVRALFQFADGVELGEEGLYWLKVHVANCGDFNKISKRPFEERAQWTTDNLDLIRDAAEFPLSMSSRDWWRQADKPFLFLAACMELISAMGCGPKFVTTLPVAWDGSCSGLQHLCAMTRAAEGSLVNLTPCGPGGQPQDVYQVVADIVKAAVQADASRPSDDATVTTLAKKCLAYGIDRKLVKRNVMTYSYSSKKYGMAEQQREDTMRPLQFKVLEGKLKKHPFGKDDGYAASSYLARHIYAAIEEVVHRPAQAMAFLQTLARRLAHEGKPLRWTTPCGLPWLNIYRPVMCERVVLFAHDRGVKVEYTAKVGIGHGKEINKDKAANGVAPNFVHALDACHLLRVALASDREGIPGLATVHDSFACHAPHTPRFRAIILEEFVRLYQTHDVLAEVRESALRDLTHDSCGSVPDAPLRGPLQIEEVLNAQFAFA
jgi:DNA-directed RNA polymerase